MSYSINDELHEFKQRLAVRGILIHKIEKVGNGNMAAFKIFYSIPHMQEMKEAFFWRHDMDKFEEKIVSELT